MYDENVRVWNLGEIWRENKNMRKMMQIRRLKNITKIRAHHCVYVHTIEMVLILLGQKFGKEIQHNIKRGGG